MRTVIATLAGRPRDRDDPAPSGGSELEPQPSAVELGRRVREDVCPFVVALLFCYYVTRRSFHRRKGDSPDNLGLDDALDEG